MAEIKELVASRTDVYVDGALLTGQDAAELWDSAFDGQGISAHVRAQITDLFTMQQADSRLQFFHSTPHPVSAPTRALTKLEYIRSSLEADEHRQQRREITIGQLTVHLTPASGVRTFLTTPSVAYHTYNSVTANDQGWDRIAMTPGVHTKQQIKATLRGLGQMFGVQPPPTSVSRNQVTDRFKRVVPLDPRTHLFLTEGSICMIVGPDPPHLRIVPGHDAAAWTNALQQDDYWAIANHLYSPTGAEERIVAEFRSAPANWTSPAWEPSLTDDVIPGYCNAAFIILLLSKLMPDVQFSYHVVAGYYYIDQTVDPHEARLAPYESWTPSTFTSTTANTGRAAHRAYQNAASQHTSGLVNAYWPLLEIIGPLGDCLVVAAGPNEVFRTRELASRAIANAAVRLGLVGWVRRLQSTAHSIPVDFPGTGPPLNRWPAAATEAEISALGLADFLVPYTPPSVQSAPFPPTPSSPLTPLSESFAAEPAQSLAAGPQLDSSMDIDEPPTPQSPPAQNAVKAPVMSVAHSMDVDTEELDWSGSEASYSPAVAVVHQTATRPESPPITAASEKCLSSTSVAAAVTALPSETCLSSTLVAGDVLEQETSTLPTLPSPSKPSPRLDDTVSIPCVSSTVSEPASEECLSSTSVASASVASKSGRIKWKPGMKLTGHVPVDLAARAATASSTAISAASRILLAPPPLPFDPSGITSTIQSDWELLSPLVKFPTFIDARSAIFHSMHNRYPRKDEVLDVGNVHIDDVINNIALRATLDERLTLPFPFPRETLITYGEESPPSDAARNYGAVSARQTLVWTGSQTKETLETWGVRTAALDKISLGNWSILAALHSIRRVNAFNIQWSGSADTGIALKLRSIDALESLLAVLRLYHDRKGETGPLFPKAYLQDYGSQVQMMGIWGTPKQFRDEWWKFISGGYVKAGRAYVLLHKLAIDFRIQHQRSALDKVTIPYVSEHMLFDFLSCVVGLQSLHLVGGPFYNPVALFREDFVYAWHIGCKETLTTLSIRDMPYQTWHCLLNLTQNITRLTLINCFSTGRSVGAVSLPDPGFVPKAAGRLEYCRIESLRLEVSGLDNAWSMDDNARAMLYWLFRSIGFQRHGAAEVRRRRAAYGPLFDRPVTQPGQPVGLTDGLGNAVTGPAPSKAASKRKKVAQKRQGTDDDTSSDSELDADFYRPSKKSFAGNSNMPVGLSSTPVIVIPKIGPHVLRRVRISAGFNHIAALIEELSSPGEAFDVNVADCDIQYISPSDADFYVHSSIRPGVLERALYTRPLGEVQSDAKLMTRLDVDIQHQSDSRFAPTDAEAIPQHPERDVSPYVQPVGLTDGLGNAVTGPAPSKAASKRKKVAQKRQGTDDDTSSDSELDADFYRPSKKSFAGNSNMPVGLSSTPVIVIPKIGPHVLRRVRISAGFNHIAALIEELSSPGEAFDVNVADCDIQYISPSDADFYVHSSIRPGVLERALYTRPLGEVQSDAKLMTRLDVDIQHQSDSRFAPTDAEAIPQHPERDVSPYVSVEEAFRISQANNSNRRSNGRSSYPASRPSNAPNLFKDSWHTTAQPRPQSYALQSSTSHSGHPSSSYNGYASSPYTSAHFNEAPPQHAAGQFGSYYGNNGSGNYHHNPGSYHSYSDNRQHGSSHRHQQSARTMYPPTASHGYNTQHHSTSTWGQTNYNNINQPPPYNTEDDGWI
ncbi:hypothetical protein EMMF5_006487 [Cystobasidiomycetes sp. EMM_F5]